MPAPKNETEINSGDPNSQSSDCFQKTMERETRAARENTPGVYDANPARNLHPMHLCLPPYPISLKMDTRGRETAQNAESEDSPRHGRRAFLRLILFWETGNVLGLAFAKKERAPKPCEISPPPESRITWPSKSAASPKASTCASDATGGTKPSMYARTAGGAPTSPSVQRCRGRSSWFPNDLNSLKTQPRRARARRVAEDIAMV